MATILALDSATDACSVALHHNGEVTHFFELAAKSHTQRLLPMVDEILTSANCRLANLDAIAFGCGPGSFTGLRICMGVVQGLAFGANLPVIPVSTLRSMARGWMEDHPHNSLPIAVALDARMDEIYGGLFSPQPLPEHMIPEFVSKPQDVCALPELATLTPQFVAIGAGWHYDGLQPILPVQVDMNRYPRAKDILTIALEEFQAGMYMSILDAQLVYLRDSVSWQKRERIRTEPITLL